MKKLPKKIIAVVMLISLAVSSMASEGNTIAASLRSTASPGSLTTPLVWAKKESLQPAELAKYRQLAENSKHLAAREAAGADDTVKTVVIVVGIVVIVVSIAAMTTYGPGSLHNAWR
jgi:hypothetical protein